MLCQNLEVFVLCDRSIRQSADRVAKRSSLVSVVRLAITKRSLSPFMWVGIGKMHGRCDVLSAWTWCCGRMRKASWCLTDLFALRRTEGVDTTLVVEWIDGIRSYGMLDGSLCCKVADLMWASYSLPSRSLHCQLVCGLARHVELQCLYALHKGQQNAMTLSCQVVDINLLLFNDRMLDRQLLRRTLEARRVLHDLVHYNWVADKHSNGGMHMFNSVFPTPEDVGALGVPQVAQSSDCLSCHNSVCQSHQTWR